jgi:hypothetical protein
MVGSRTCAGVGWGNPGIGAVVVRAFTVHHSGGCLEVAFDNSKLEGAQLEDSSGNRELYQIAYVEEPMSRAAPHISFAGASD